MSNSTIVSFSKHVTGKMPALDTQLLIQDGRVRYEHYRKPMANPLVMVECSAMPIKIKRTTLTQEVVRIHRNTSRELPKETVAKHLNEFTSRMKASGYPEKFRLEVIKSGVEGFEKMVKIEEEGGRPVNRPRSWETDLRQKQKQFKGRNWFRNGGHHVPLFIPHTPGSKLAKLVRAKEEENNQGRKIRFLVCEVGGTQLHNVNWKPNPWSGGKCSRVNCFPCKGETGGNCWRPGCTYSLNCDDCTLKYKQNNNNKVVEVAQYKGETGKNGFERGKQHLKYLQKKDTKESVLWLHSLHHHQGREDIKYSMSVTGIFKEPLDRQIMEKVQISNFQGDILMNRKNELGGALLEREQFKYSRWGAGGQRAVGTR